MTAARNLCSKWTMTVCLSLFTSPTCYLHVLWRPSQGEKAMGARERPWLPRKSSSSPRLVAYSTVFAVGGRHRQSEASNCLVNAGVNGQAGSLEEPPVAPFGRVDVLVSGERGGSSFQPGEVKQLPSVPIIALKRLNGFGSVDPIAPSSRII